ncbi:ABC transporter ATP-binding protein/permease [Xylanimonas allomyrinae]|uniref:ABC transporter ATP-binding protein/permease n=1 Tax=Xylanimonas allomyrinae TaxID=2509459 RepID=A0A4V0YE32_9MICO|nr:ABC transporter ATP-binding protein/permease [Xylanimonas allomyrinae]QAY62801.1 ABC transporter ATP-binding protein/permease [Xylanimonas allomyrinae]
MADAPLISLHGITRRFSDGTVAVAGVDLDVDPGEVVAIVGPSGSGKSTLLNVLGLLDKPSSGSIMLGGVDVSGLDDGARSDLRSADLAFVFQRAHLLPSLTVAENVGIGIEYSPDRRDTDARVGDALERCGLGPKADALARTLSGGEMQRAAIARALVRRAQLWLADEPTGNLDSAQSVLIIDELRARAADAGAALIVVTHEPDIAARLGRTVTLRDGRVVSDLGGSNRGMQSLTPPNAPARRTLGLVRALRTCATMLRARTPGARAGVVAASIAVALTVTALGLSQSAAAQVTGLFDAQRAAQVTASLSREDATIPWNVRVAEVRSFPGVTGTELWTLYQQLPVAIGDYVTGTADVVTTAATPGAASGTTIAWAPHTEHRLTSGEALVGSALARRLGLASIDAGPEITVAGQRLRVVGLLDSERTGTAAGTIFVSDDALSHLSGSLSATLFVTTVPGGARQVADVLKPLADPFGQARIDIDPVLGPEAFAGALTDSVGVSLQVLAVVAALAGLGTVVFVNLLGITSRRAELGVRRAFGARRGEIAVIVASECAARSLLGAVIGLLVGLVAILAVTITARWEPVFDLRLLSVPLAGALFFGLVGGVAPAVHAARIEPADAVRS